MQAHRGSNGIALSVLYLRTKLCGGKRNALSALPSQTVPVPLAQEFEEAPWWVWTGAENIASTGFRLSDPPLRSTVCSIPAKQYLQILNKTGKVRVT